MEAGAPAETPDRRDPLRRVTLGRSGIRTTLLGMGTGFGGYNRSSVILRAGTAEALIRQAYEKGIRCFDLADAYGTHQAAAAALKGQSREDFTLVTKIWTAAEGLPEPERPDAAVVVDRFRQELGTEYLDLVQLHHQEAGDWTDQQKRLMDGLETLKSRQVIRAHGVSIHSFEALRTAADSPWVDVVHARINPYGVAMDRRNPAEVLPVLEQLHRSGKGVIGMKLIGNGLFEREPQMVDASLKYVLGLGTVDMVVIGFERPGQIDDALARMKMVLAG